MPKTGPGRKPRWSGVAYICGPVRTRLVARKNNGRAEGYGWQISQIAHGVLADSL